MSCEFIEMLLTMDSVVNIVMLIVAVPLIERLGRRALLLWCGPISIVSLLIIGGILRATGPAVGPALITFAQVTLPYHTRTFIDRL